MGRSSWIVLLAVATACAPEAPSQWTATVGPGGGRIVGEGIELTFPAGAVDRDHEIRITRTDEVPPDGWTALSPIYRFEPDGLVFAEPVEVRFRTDREDPAERVAWISGASSTIEEVTVVRAGDELLGAVRHFSRGFAGVASSEAADGGPSDAGVGGEDAGDGGLDAGPDGDVDGGSIPVGIADISCWMHEVVETSTVAPSDVVVGNDDRLYFLLGPTLFERSATGWVETHLPTAASFGPTSGAAFGPSDLAIDDTGAIHAVLQELSRTGPPLDSPFPYYVRQTSAGWAVEEIPFTPGGYISGPSPGPCNASFFEPWATEIAVGGDGAVHVVYDCYEGASRPVFHSVRSPVGWATAAKIPGVPLIYMSQSLNPQIAVDSGGVLHAYAEFEVDLSWAWSTMESGAWTPFSAVDTYEGLIKPYPTRRGTFFLDDGRPAAFYVYFEGLAAPCDGTPETCSNRPSVRRAERIGGAFVDELVQDYAWPVSDVARNDDGIEYLITEGVGTYEYAPTGARTALALSESEQWSATLPAAVPAIDEHVHLAVDHAGVLHGIYAGTDDQVHHIWTCR